MLLVSLFSCSEVSDESLAKLPVDESEKTALEITERGSTSVNVSFEYISRAEEYRIETRAKDEKLASPDAVLVNSSDFSDGVFTASVNSLIPGSTYSFHLFAKNSAMDNFVEVTETSGTEYTLEKGVPARDPSVSITQDKGMLAIRVNAENGYAYKATLSNSQGNVIKTGDWKYFYDESEGQLLLLEAETEEGESYTYIIESAYYTTLDLTYQTEGEISLSTFSIESESDGIIKITGELPSATSAIVLYDGDEEIIREAYSNQRELTLPDGIGSLRTMSLSLSALNQDGNLIASSLPITYTTGLEIESTEATQQHIRINVDLRDTDYSFYYSLDNGNEEQISYDSSANAFIISGLESLTEYEVTILAKKAGKTVASDTATETTTTFKGVYSWTNETEKTDDSYQSNFVVEVVEAPAESSFKYYVLTHQDDNLCKGEYADTVGLRISPLLKDNESLSDSVTYPSDEAGAMKNAENPNYLRAYVWNNLKWNSSTNKPDTFNNITASISGDKVTATADSTALGVTLTTTTEFEFIEEDGKTKLKFFNKITGNNGGLFGGIAQGIANNALRKNPDPGTDVNGEYTFYLEMR